MVSCTKGVRLRPRPGSERPAPILRFAMSTDLVTPLEFETDEAELLKPGTMAKANRVMKMAETKRNLLDTRYRGRLLFMVMNLLEYSLERVRATGNLVPLNERRGI